MDFPREPCEASATGTEPTTGPLIEEHEILAHFGLSRNVEVAIDQKAIGANHRFADLVLLKKLGESTDAHGFRRFANELPPTGLGVLWNEFPVCEVSQPLDSADHG